MGIWVHAHAEALLGGCIGRECVHPYAGTVCPDCGDDTPVLVVLDELALRRAE